MPQMDGLRAVAVLPVLYQHHYEPAIPVGSWGVVLFFVISGFLITQNLFTLRDAGVPVRPAAWRFFGRRALRLLPAYYLALLIGLATVPTLREVWAWYAAYASNVLFALSPFPVGQPLLPTWSLAVEQQFYVLWFLVIMLAPLPCLRWLLPAFALGAMLFRGCALAAGAPSGIYLLPSCLDALAFGAFLCLAERAGWALGHPAALAAVPLAAAAAVTLVLGWPHPVAVVAWPSLVALASASAVWHARDGFAGLTGALLGFRPVAYLGRISYGIYIYHMLTPQLATVVPGFWRLGFPGHVAVTVAVAALSYHLVEQPLLRRRWGRTVEPSCFQGREEAADAKRT